MFDSGSDEDGPSPAQRASGDKLKSMFAADKAAASATRNTSLKYEAAKEKRAVAAVRAPAATPAGGVPPNPEQMQTMLACTAAVMAYKGDTYVGACAALVAVQPSQSNVILMDREKRPLAKVRVDEQLQMLPNKEEPNFATIYDPALMLHWSLRAGS